MKKNYITPKINVVQFEALCSGGIGMGSIFKESTKGECIDNFGVVNEENVKGTGYEGYLESDNWGDD
jgi:hypothetical protein